MWRDHRYDLPASGDDPMETVISVILIFLSVPMCVIAAHLVDRAIEWLCTRN